MTTKKPQTNESKRQGIHSSNCKYTKYSALLQALAYCEPVDTLLFNRLKKRVLWEHSKI